MARITVSDSLLHIPNRFALVVLAAHRAKEIALGSPRLLSSNKKHSDKFAVQSLREIAAGLLTSDSLYNAVVKKYQRRQVLEIEDKLDDIEANNLFNEEIALTSSSSAKNSKMYIADDGDEEDVDNEEDDENLTEEE